MTDPPKPERVKSRVPSVLNRDTLSIMLKEAKISGIAIIVNSIERSPEIGPALR